MSVPLPGRCPGADRASRRSVAVPKAPLAPGAAWWRSCCAWWPGGLVEDLVAAWRGLVAQLLRLVAWWPGRRPSGRLARPGGAAAAPGGLVAWSKTWWPPGAAWWRSCCA